VFNYTLENANTDFDGVDFVQVASFSESFSFERSMVKLRYLLLI
jgi:hypothetical protein